MVEEADMQVVDYRAPYRADPYERPYFLTWGHVGSGVLGVAFLLAGSLVLARLFPESLSGTTSLLGLRHTAALGIVELVLGIVFLSAATAPWSARGTLVTMGIGTIVFGLVTTVEPATFGDAGLAGTGAAIAFAGIAAVFIGWSDRPMSVRR